MKMLTRFPNPETPMSQELLDALTVFSTACMAGGIFEVCPEDVVAYLIENEGPEIARQFKPDCLFPVFPATDN